MLQAAVQLGLATRYGSHMHEVPPGRLIRDDEFRAPAAS
jgi:hypothetical protein